MIYQALLNRHGDCDYSERVNIKTSTREEACHTLSRVMREKAISKLKGSTCQLIEVRFGNYHITVVRDGQTYKAGTPVSWSAAEVEEGQFAAIDMDSRSLRDRAGMSR